MTGLLHFLPGLGKVMPIAFEHFLKCAFLNLLHSRLHEMVGGLPGVLWQAVQKSFAYLAKVEQSSQYLWGGVGK